MAKYFKILVLFSLLAISSAHEEEAPPPSEFEAPPPSESVSSETPPETFHPDAVGDFNGDQILLLEWIPFPINKYKFLVQNTSDGIVHEEGVTTLDQITKAQFPDVRAAMACVPGDGDFIFLEDIPLITVDAFRDDHHFQEYQDIIYTIHGFEDKIHLWAHFLQYPEAFSPVRDRLSAAFQEFLENGVNGDLTPPKVINEPVEDFNAIE